VGSVIVQGQKGTKALDKGVRHIINSDSGAELALLCRVQFALPVMLWTDKMNYVCSGVVCIRTLPCVMRQRLSMLPGFGASLIRRTLSAAGRQPSVCLQIQAGVLLVTDPSFQPGVARNEARQHLAVFSKPKDVFLMSCTMQ
jgi:hypothetical protein